MRHHHARAVGDLTQYEGSTVVRHDLTHLSPQAGAQLLRELKVKGTEAELEAAAREYGVTGGPSV